MNNKITQKKINKQREVSEGTQKIVITILTHDANESSSLLIPKRGTLHLKLSEKHLKRQRATAQTSNIVRLERH